MFRSPKLMTIGIHALFPLPNQFTSPSFSRSIIVTPIFPEPAAGRGLECLDRSASYTVFKHKVKRELHENKKPYW
jgi:hypothetical protein